MAKRLSLHSQKGFTFIELLFYVVLVAAVLIVTTRFSVDVLADKNKSQSQHEVYQNARQILREIGTVSRDAKAIVSLAATDLVLRNSDDSLSRFYLDGATLLYQHNAETPIALNSSLVTVSALNFTNLSNSRIPGNIKITFTVAHTNPGGRNDFDVSQDLEAVYALRPQN